MAQADIDYLDKTYPGGASAYIANQQNRYRNATSESERQALRDDAKRVGYSLPTVSPPPSTGGPTGYVPTDTKTGGTPPITVDPGWLSGFLQDTGKTVTGGVESTTRNMGFALIVGVGVLFVVMSIVGAFRRAR